MNGERGGERNEERDGVKGGGGVEMNGSEAQFCQPSQFSWIWGGAGGAAGSDDQMG